MNNQRKDHPRLHVQKGEPQKDHSSTILATVFVAGLGVVVLRYLNSLSVEQLAEIWHIKAAGEGDPSPLVGQALFALLEFISAETGLPQGFILGLIIATPFFLLGGYYIWNEFTSKQKK